MPPGFANQNIPSRNGVSRVVVPHRARRHEDWAILTIHPLLEVVHFANVQEVLEEFLEVNQVGVRDVQ